MCASSNCCKSGSIYCCYVLLWKSSGQTMIPKSALRFEFNPKNILHLIFRTLTWRLVLSVASAANDHFLIHNVQFVISFNSKRPIHIFSPTSEVLLKECVKLMGDFSEGLKLWKQNIDWTYLTPNVNIGNWTLSYCKQINLDDVVYCVHVTYWKWNTTSYFWCKIVIYHTHVDCISHCHFCNCACLLSVSEFVCVVLQRLVAWLDKLYWYAQKYVETYAGSFLLTTTKLKVWLATQNQFNFTMKSNANFQF